MVSEFYILQKKMNILHFNNTFPYTLIFLGEGNEKISGQARSTGESFFINCLLHIFDFLLAWGNYLCYMIQLQETGSHFFAKT